MAQQDWIIYIPSKRNVHSWISYILFQIRAKKSPLHCYKNANDFSWEKFSWWIFYGWHTKGSVVVLYIYNMCHWGEWTFKNQQQQTNTEENQGEMMWGIWASRASSCGYKTSILFVYIDSKLNICVQWKNVVKTNKIDFENFISFRTVGTRMVFLF